MGLSEGRADDDAIYNPRSSLDYLTSALVPSNQHPVLVAACGDHPRFATSLARRVAGEGVDLADLDHRSIGLIASRTARSWPGWTSRSSSAA